MNRKMWVMFLGLCAIVGVGLVLLTGCSKKPSEETQRSRIGAADSGFHAD